MYDSWKTKVIFEWQTFSSLKHVPIQEINLEKVEQNSGKFILIVKHFRDAMLLLLVKNVRQRILKPF